MKMYAKRKLVSYVYYYKNSNGDDVKSIELDDFFTNIVATEVLKEALNDSTVKVIGKNKITRVFNVSNEVIKKYGDLISEEVV